MKLQQGEGENPYRSPESRRGDDENLDRSAESQREGPDTVRRSWLLIVCSVYVFLPLTVIVLALYEIIVATISGTAIPPYGIIECFVCFSVIFGPVMLLHAVSLVFRECVCAVLVAIFYWLALLLSAGVVVSIVSSLANTREEVLLEMAGVFGVLSILNLFTACVLTAWASKLVKAKLRSVEEASSEDADD